MITAVDTSVLIAITKGEPDALEWTNLLASARADGDLVICDVVAAEIFALLMERATFQRTITGLGNGLTYQCLFLVARSLCPGKYPLECTEASAASPSGMLLPTGCIDGELILPTQAGDCDGDGRITVDEVVLGAGIALNDHELAACPSFDVNLDGVVTIDELVPPRNLALMCP